MPMIPNALVAEPACCVVLLDMVTPLTFQPPRIQVKRLVDHSSEFKITFTAECDACGYVRDIVPTAL